jgi:hypothetical protein
MPQDFYNELHFENPEHYLAYSYIEEGGLDWLW